MKQVIAPVVIVVLVLLSMLSGLLVVFVLPLPLPFRIVLGVLSLLFSGALVSVLIERIKEIIEEDEDDIGKY